MTFKVTVKDNRGNPIPFAVVVANDELVGTSFSRGTDGGGYADVDVKATPIGRQMTLYVQAPGYYNNIQYPTTGSSDQTINVVLQPFSHPFKVAPRFWKGNMCGVRIPGAPSVPGGSSDSSLILDWFYGKYPNSFKPTIVTNWVGKGITHCLQSWPDMRAFGQNEDDFIRDSLDLLDFDIFPNIMLSSKDFDVPDVDTIMAGLSNLIPKMKQAGIPMACIGWELSLWLSPTQVQQLIDLICPELTPIGCRMYVHFQQGYGSFQQPGGTVADFWNLNIGKLTGLLHQKIESQTPDQYRYDSGGIMDMLQRFAGGFNCSDDSGFGHPFDFVALEITANGQFNGSVSESQGNSLGQFAIESPHVFGPRGTEVWVMGSGNGFL